MKKLSLIIIILLLVIFITGCDGDKKVVVDGKKIDTTTMEHKHCVRNGSLDGGEVSLEYDLYYTKDILNIVKSVEEVTSNDEEVLDTYEEAYKKIHSHYEGIDNYEASVIRSNTKVTSTILINYDKINYDELIEIEGEEDNIFENKKASVDKWLELGKKFGVTCQKVEE